MRIEITRETLSIMLIAILALAIRAFLIPSFHFTSDESMYVYDSFAISKGVVPYHGVQLASLPLSYMIYASIIKFIGSNLYYARLSNTMFFVATVPLTHLFAKRLLKDRKGASIFGLMSAAIYAFYPPLIPYTLAVGPEFILTFFTLSSVTIYIALNSPKKKYSLFLVGVIMGLAVLTKLTAIYFVGAVMFYHVMVTVLNKKSRDVIVDIMRILLGFSVPIAILLAWAGFQWNALKQLYLQTFYWHTIRFPASYEERLSALQFSTQFYLPLIVLGALGGIILIRIAKRSNNTQLVLPVWLSVANVCAIFLLTPTVNPHYFFFLTPYFAILCSACFFHIRPLLHRDEQQPTDSKKHKFVALSTFFILMILLSSQIIVWQYPLIAPYFHPFESQWTRVEYYVGSYVATLDSSEQMWTSEGGIAFFAGKTIVPPNSTEWPLHAFYTDALGYSFQQCRSDEMKDYKRGVVSIPQFIESWEKEQVKVIVIIRGAGWIPYPDELLWDGIYDQEGISNYVNSKYELRQLITISGVPYTYEVWLRK